MQLLSNCALFTSNQNRTVKSTCYALQHPIVCLGQSGIHREIKGGMKQKTGKILYLSR